MRIMITGSPGSNHNLIGRKLAERLELNFYSAKDVACEYCASKGTPYYLFQTHKDQDADNYVTGRIRELSVKNDAVVDSLLAKSGSNCHRVCIHQDLLADRLRAASWYEDEVTERWFTDDDAIFGYSPASYDITVSRLYLTDDQVVSAIIRSLTAGVFKANYVHPFQVLPLHPEYLPTALNTYTDKSYVFHAVKFGFVYLLNRSGEYPQYLRYLKERRLMRIELLDAAPSFDKLPAEADYAWLNAFMPEECRETLMTAYLLLKYCIAFDAADYKQVYLELSKNTDPYKRLKEVVS